MAELSYDFGALTSREREVMALVVTGRPNKQIAAELGVSEITVTVHRGQAMRKMGALVGEAAADGRQVRALRPKVVDLLNQSIIASTLPVIGAFLTCMRSLPTCNGFAPSHRVRLAAIRKVEVSKKPVISIVDDDESVREATKGLMTAVGVIAEAFSSAEDFLKSDRRHDTSCLIADVQMPGMSGLELHGRLAASGRPIPTILITAYPDERTRSRALRAGVVGYLAKPFDEDELLDCIHSAIDGEHGGKPS